MPGTALTEASGNAPGVFGKIPSLGDFVTRRLPRQFIERWDGWLQRGLVTSRERLDDSWLELYLNGPIWRFLLPADLVGPTRWIGVLMPSVDKAGRHFPLTIAAAAPRSDQPLQVLSSGARWFSRIEELALSSLDDHFDLETFDTQLQGLTVPGLDNGRVRLCPGKQNGGEAWYLAAASPADAEPLLLGLADAVAASHLRDSSFWQTSGSKSVAPTLLVCSGLPTPLAFTALVDGDGGRWGCTPTRQGGNS